MEVTYYLFLVMLMCAGMDGVQTGNVLLPQALRAIKKDGGIRIRPLMRNDQPNGIYLMSDQRQPPLVTLRTHYPPHQRLQLQQQQQQLNKQQQQGFIIRNSIGRHPHRPAPVSINNHLGVALAGGNNNPGRGKFHHANRQQPLKQQHQLNHQFQTVNVPTNIHYNNNKQPTSNHHEQNGHTIRQQPDPAPAPMILPHTKPNVKEESVKLMSDDAQNLMKLELEGNDYLTYLYLGMNETRLMMEGGNPGGTTKNAGDQMTHPPPTDDDDDIIIGSPTMHFDPYLSRNQSFTSKSSAENVKDHHDRTRMNIIKSLDDDWLPISSPWDKYGNKSESNLQ